MLSRALLDGAYTLSAGGYTAEFQGGSSQSVPGVGNGLYQFPTLSSSQRSEWAAGNQLAVSLVAHELTVRVEPVQTAIRAGEDARFRVVASHAPLQNTNVRVLIHKPLSSVLTDVWINPGRTEAICALPTAVALAGSGAAHADGSRELTYRWRIADASNGELTGLKLTSGPNLEAGLAFGHRETGRGAPEGAIELNGSMRW